MFARLFMLLATLTLVNCAQANYEDANRGPAEAGQGTCDIPFVNEKICANLIWEKKPTETEFGSFVLEFYSPDDRSLFVDPPGVLGVLLWMPSMGHGSSPVTVEKVANGQYRVSKVFFTMHGDWEIQLKISSGGNILDQVAFPFHF